MSRSLPSSVTVIFKIGFVFWVVASAVSLDIERLRTVPWSTILVLPWLAVTYLLWISWWRLKRVALEGEVLAVSNYIQTWRVQAAEISAVVEGRWNTLHPIFIHFKSRQPFGRVVMFMPRQDLDFVGRPHPFVIELRALAGLKPACVS